MRRPAFCICEIKDADQLQSNSEADQRLCFRYTDSTIPQLRKYTRIDVYETLCPQQMLVHKGGQIKNWVGECRDVTPTNCSLKTCLKRALGGGGGGGGGSGWRGQDGCE